VGGGRGACLPAPVSLLPYACAAGAGTRAPAYHPRLTLTANCLCSHIYFSLTFSVNTLVLQTILLLQDTATSGGRLACSSASSCGTCLPQTVMYGRKGQAGPGQEEGGRRLQARVCTRLHARLRVSSTRAMRASTGRPAYFLYGIHRLGASHSTL